MGICSTLDMPPADCHAHPRRLPDPAPTLWTSSRPGCRTHSRGCRAPPGACGCSARLQRCPQAASRQQLLPELPRLRNACRRAPAPSWEQRAAQSRAVGSQQRAALSTDRVPLLAILRRAGLQGAADQQQLRQLLPGAALGLDAAQDPAQLAAALQKVSGLWPLQGCSWPAAACRPCPPCSAAIFHAPLYDAL